jgi:two-component system cell cycle sensor histidine kinase/response regulator CckA
MSAPIPSQGNSESGGTPRPRAVRIALRTTLVYAVAAGMWILLSDRLVGALFSDPETLVRVAMLKGFGFVGCTALLLYGLLHAQLVRWEREVQARRATEDALRDSERMFRSVVETIHEVFWIADPAESRLLYVSPRFERIWGRRCADLAEASEAWQSALHPDDRERMLAIARGKNPPRGYDETYRIIRPDGETRWIRDRAFPVCDDAGVVSRVVGVAEDVTERKQMEQQFLRGQRLESIGTLASGVAHDMNNILAPMLLVPRLLRSRLAQEGDRQMLDLVESGAKRGSEIVQQLLTFSRGLEGRRGPVHFHQLLKEMTNIMRETFPREIEVLLSVGPGLWPVTADATQMHQVLMNLCVNSRDAMPHGGRLRLGAENVALGAEAARLHPAARSGSYVILTVSDTGLGMPPEVLERIFDPFFTTKEVGRGTGLGLATVLGIVKSHTGFLLVESQPGQGTTFRVYLPAGKGEGELGGEGSAETLPRGNHELILLVDDEAAIRASMQLMLQTHDYEVMVAADGVEALRLWEAHRDRVRLVMTDLMMPGMNGVALMRELRRRSPQLPLVASTGLNHDRNLEELAALGVDDLLRKPFAPRDVLELLHRRLARDR